MKKEGTSEGSLSNPQPLYNLDFFTGEDQCVLQITMGSLKMVSDNLYYDRVEELYSQVLSSFMAAENS